MSLNIMGIWASKDSATCCLLQDGLVKFTAQEEEFYDNEGRQPIPVKAFNFCLDSADISITDINCITLCEGPEKALESQILKKHLGKRHGKSSHTPHELTIDKVKKFFGYTGPVVCINHQVAHAAFGYYPSSFNEAAIMVVDTAGPWILTSYGYGKGEEIGMLEYDINVSVIGIVSSLVVDYLGFDVDNEKYKVKLLAKGGKPLYTIEIQELMDYIEENKSYMYSNALGMNEICRRYSGRLVELLKTHKENSTSCITQFHKDVAISMQFVLEEFLLNRAKYIYDKTGLKNLCISGELVSDCITNMRVLEKLPFEEVFIHRACGDNTCAIGSVMEEYLERTQRLESVKPVDNLFLGPEYSAEKIEHILRVADIEYDSYLGREDEMLSFIVDMLTKGKTVGWFNGRTGIGSVYPCTRLILADPRKETLYEDFCSILKSNDGLIPFCYAILGDGLERSCSLDANSSALSIDTEAFRNQMLMEFNHMNIGEKMLRVNANEAPLLHKLIQKFYTTTGYGALANTPLKLRNGENVLTLLQAIEMFVTSKVDLLVIGNFVLEREKNAKPFVSWLRIQFNNL